MLELQTLRTLAVVVGDQRGQSKLTGYSVHHSHSHSTMNSHAWQTTSTNACIGTLVHSPASGFIGKTLVTIPRVTTLPFSQVSKT